MPAPTMQQQAAALDDAPAPWVVMANQLQQQQMPGRGPASVGPEQMPAGLPPGLEAQPSPAIAANPDIQAMMPSFQPYEPTPEQKQLMAEMQKAANEQLGKQQGGIEDLQKLLAERKNKMSNINWTPLASYVDSNMPDSHLVPGAEAMNRENEKTTALQEQIQGAQNLMSKDRLQNLGEQLKAAQFGSQLAHQAKVDSAQQQKAANALITGAERQWNSDKVLGLYTLRMDGASNILDVLNKIESSYKSKDPNHIKLTSNLLSNVYNELGRLETGGQAVSEQLIHEGGQRVAELDFNKAKTLITGAVAEPSKIPENVAQARLLLSEMMGNYNKAMARRGQVLSEIGGVSPLQSKVFEAKAKATAEKYGGLISDDGGYIVGKTYNGHKYLGGGYKNPKHWEQ